MSQTSWVNPVVSSPHAKYGLRSNAPATSVDSPLASVAGHAPSDVVAAWHLDSPLFWFGAIAAATFGLLAVTTSVRVGPAKAGVSLGTP